MTVNRVALGRTIEEALNDMDDPNEKVLRSPYTDQLDLFTTFTDIQGQTIALKLADLVAADRVEGRLGECVAELLERRQADVVNVPLDRHAGRFDGAARGVDDLGPGAVAWDQGDAVRQSDLPFAACSLGIVRSASGHRTVLSLM